MAEPFGMANASLATAILAHWVDVLPSVALPVPEPDARNCRYRVSGILASITHLSMNPSIAHVARIIGLGLLSWFSLACECSTTPIKQQIKSTPTIVKGRVIKLLDTPERRRSLLDSNSNSSYDVSVLLTTVYKGTLAVNDTIHITTSGPTNCDLYFRSGAEYVLFLEPGETDLRVRSCSASMPLEQASHVVGALHEWQKGETKK